MELLEISQLPREGESIGSVETDAEVFTLIDAALPRAPWVLVKRARCFLAQEDREKAVAYLASAVDSVGDDLLARLDIVRVCSELADWNSMIRTLRDLAPHRLECLPLIAYRARAWIELGQWNQALGDLAGLAEMDLGDDDLMICQALVHLAARNEDAHRRLRSELLARAVGALDPCRTIPILEALLAVPSDGLDARRILALAELAAAKSPENLRLAGAARYRNKQFAAALETFAGAARASPPPAISQQARDHFFLAMAHQQLDQPGQAREHLRRGVEALAALATVKDDDSETGLNGACERIALAHLRHEAEQVVQN
jgi:hypothetical protein